MASKVYIEVICVLLCTAVCILDGCRAVKEILNKCRDKNAYHVKGNIFRYVLYDACVLVKCYEGNWYSHKTECKHADWCYENGEILSINGVRWLCEVKDLKSQWKQLSRTNGTIGGLP
ncbi:hypothetical protein PoB_004089800 [Plakobranchus ocellatus]|uniref:Uncharacterized protein n=1 Tax=Plakobranchus ocellatus TaxID=259542 RepID=A0AAV4B4A4_9GAST|nr:hypothetical protein PoB_004089800 [Plakobranchus ocellatus]